MGKKSAGSTGALILSAIITLVLIACTDGPSTAELNGPDSTQEVSDAMEFLLSLTPGQSTESNVVSQYGEAGGTEEPLLGEWTWLYPLSEDGSSVARLTFDTSSSIKIVQSVEVIEPEMAIADLTEAYGDPEIVFEDLTREKFIQTYPLRGIEAVVMGDPDRPTEPLLSLSRKVPETAQAYLDHLQERTDVRIIREP